MIDINPCIDFEIDCFQNLQMMFLKHYNMEIRYLGAVWPWLFELKYLSSLFENEMWIDIQNKDCIDKKKLNELYGLSQETFSFKNMDSIWMEICNLLDHNIPVLVGMDGFYVSYHYPHIYKKQHGLHTTMVVGYDKLTQDIFCVSEIPKFKGVIPFGEFVNGVKSDKINVNKNPWYTIILNKENIQNPDESLVWQNFILELDKLKLDELVIDKDMIMPQTVGLMDVIEILRKLILIEDDSELSKKIEVMCRGAWGWHIDRRGNLLIQYLKMHYVKSNFSNWGKCIQLIELGNKNWVAAYRWLHKGIYGNTRTMLLRAIDKLLMNIKVEKEILQLLTKSNNY